MGILFVSIAPVIIIAAFVFYRDKYEKEPLKMLLKAIAIGCIITIPVSFIEQWLIGYSQFEGMSKAFYDAFFVAGFTEELFKYLAFLIIIWNNKNFDEKFDGIVYATFISLGFAAIENILYVFVNGYEVGIMRAFTAVPAHALFGITMGFYFGLARFFPEQKTEFMFRALLYPIVLHGLYDFILMSQNGFIMLGFIPYIIWLWYRGFSLMKQHSETSRYKDDYNKTTQQP